MRKPITSIECDIWMGNDLITAPPDHYRRSPDPREKGLPLSLTQMAHGFFDGDGFADLGFDGDGTDLYGDCVDTGVHRSNPDADRVGRFLTANRGQFRQPKPRQHRNGRSGVDHETVRLTPTMLRRRPVTEMAAATE